MKKQLTATFVILSIFFSINSFAQVDSSKIASTQRQIDKDQKRADKLERKAEKQARKQKRHENKMIQKEKKKERKLNKIQKNERKLEDLKKDTTGTGAIQNIYPVTPTKGKDAILINDYSFSLAPRYKKITYEFLKPLNRSLL
jgi:Skp family chaperone for outer membrane proteins